jgi:hypothetical protein
LTTAQAALMADNLDGQVCGHLDAVARSSSVSSGGGLAGGDGRWHGAPRQRLWQRLSVTTDASRIDRQAMHPWREGVHFYIFSLLYYIFLPHLVFGRNSTWA